MTTSSWIYKYPPESSIIESMKCPTCKAPTQVLRTVAMGKDYLRRRECYNGHRFTTKEVVDPDDTQLPRVSPNVPDAPTP